MFSNKKFFGVLHSAQLAAEQNILPNNTSILATFDVNDETQVFFNDTHKTIAVLNSGTATLVSATGQKSVNSEWGIPHIKDVAIVGFMDAVALFTIPFQRQENDVEVCKELYAVNIMGKTFLLQPVTLHTNVAYKLGDGLMTTLLPRTLGDVVETFSLNLVELPNDFDSVDVDAYFSADEGVCELYATKDGFALSLNRGQFFCEYNSKNEPVSDSIQYPYESLSMTLNGMPEERKGFLFETALRSGTHFRLDADGSVALDVQRVANEAIMRGVEADSPFTLENVPLVPTLDLHSAFQLANTVQAHPDGLGFFLTQKRSCVQELNDNLALLWCFEWVLNQKWVQRPTKVAVLKREVETIELNWSV